LKEESSTVSSPLDKLKRRVRSEINARKYTGPMPAGSPKFDKFTARARKVLSLAQEEAQRLQHNYIGTEHLLLGLVREGEGIAAHVLTDLDVDLNAVRERVEYIIGRGEHHVAGAVGLTPRSKKVFELAVDEARRLGHRYIGTEHLLLGLVREGEGIGAGVLESFGLNLEQVRRGVIAALAQHGADAFPEGPPAGPKNNVVTCRLDDRAVDALDALVEAGIRTTRSEAAAWLIAAGIEAHRPLFQRVQQTLDEIRRLRTEAREIARQVATGGMVAADGGVTEAGSGAGAPDQSGARAAKDAQGETPPASEPSNPSTPGEVKKPPATPNEPSA
jgi:hypothetical protein